MDEKLLNLHDFERCAQRLLDKGTFDYFAGGSGDELTINENRNYFKNILLSPKILTDVSNRCLSTTVLGKKLTMPLIAGPTAFHRLVHKDGEFAASAAARKFGIPMVVSMLASASIEELTQKNAGPLWMNMFAFKDKGMVRELIRRAEDAKCEAVVITLSTRVFDKHERDERNGFSIPENIIAGNLAAHGVRREGSYYKFLQENLDASFTWKELESLIKTTKVPIVLKGIVRRDDARRAFDVGARGIVVSNHGGRQLDSMPSGLRTLRDVVAGANGIDVMVDGGFRRGTDIMKALAMGAKAVLVGRPIVWGLAVNGQDGVFEVLDILRQEFDRAMALCGCASISEVTEDLIYSGNCLGD